MDLIQLLQSFDLSATESKVYLAALTKDYLTAGEIARLAQVGRSTVYHSLQTLADKGLMAKAGTKVEKFKVQPVAHLLSVLNRKKAELDDLQNKFEQALPFFPTNNGHAGHSPHIEYFHGLDGLKNLVEKMLYSKSKLIHTIGAPFKLMESSDNTYIRHFLQERAKKGIQTKSIWQDLPKDTALRDNKTLLRDVRLAPKEMRGESSTMISIVDDSVIVVNFLPELFGFLVTSRGFSDSMKAIWEVLWAQSTPLD